MADYERLNAISEGTYGVVHRARDKKTGEIVAVKVVHKERIPLFSREIDILKSLPPHPSVVEFKQAGTDKHGRVYVVMEYVKNDLSKLMAKQKGRFTSSEIKRMMKQLLEGVTFLHDNGVMHRDLKPNNILVTDKGDLKICDFGLSARFGAGTIMWYDPHVGTLRYKAPEILLGRRAHSCAVDMWAVGCIMAELVLNQQLFKGSTEVDQLACIQRTICMSWNWLRFRLSRNASSSVMRLLTPSCIDLLERLLAYKPEERISAKEALDHIWFKEYCAPTNCFSLRIRELYTWCNERLNVNFWIRASSNC